MSALLICAVSFNLKNPRKFRKKAGGVSVAKELDGENISGGYMSAQEIMDAWINSPPHNANMLYSKFKKIGISVFVLKSPLYGIDMYFAAQSFGY